MANVVLFDGVCGLCNRIVQFILKHDKQRAFQFASLQSPIAQEILNGHGVTIETLDTVYVVTDFRGPNEAVLSKGDAFIEVGRRLGGIWRMAVVLRLLPRWCRNVAYDWIAKRRYRLFGRYDACWAPTAELRNRFIDQPSASAPMATGT